MLLAWDNTSVKYPQFLAASEQRVVAVGWDAGTLTLQWWDANLKQSPAATVATNQPLAVTWGSDVSVLVRDFTTGSAQEFGGVPADSPLAIGASGTGKFAALYPTRVAFGGGGGAERSDNLGGLTAISWLDGVGFRPHGVRIRPPGVRISLGEALAPTFRGYDGL